LRRRGLDTKILSSRGYVRVQRSEEKSGEKKLEHDLMLPGGGVGARGLRSVSSNKGETCATGSEKEAEEKGGTTRFWLSKERDTGENLQWNKRAGTGKFFGGGDNLGHWGKLNAM